MAKELVMSREQGGRTWYSAYCKAKNCEYVTSEYLNPDAAAKTRDGHYNATHKGKNNRPK